MVNFEILNLAAQQMKDGLEYFSAKCKRTRKSFLVHSERLANAKSSNDFAEIANQYRHLPTPITKSETTYLKQCERLITYL